MKGFFKELHSFFSSENDGAEKGQFNAFLAGPILVITGVIIVIMGTLMINAIEQARPGVTNYAGGGALPGNEQSMLNFIPYAGIGVVIGGILLTIITVFGFFGNR